MNTSKVADQVELTSNGLPADWIKEVKTRKEGSSRKDVFYIDPKTGYAFRSLKDALSYVKTGDIHSCASRPRKRSLEEIKTVGSQTVKTESAMSPDQPSNLIKDRNPTDHVAREDQLTSHGLPANWIKELKPRKHGSTKMDRYYIDPETGYAFPSLKDALRYVATGNILSCVGRPKKRSIEEVQALMRSSEMASISGTKTVEKDRSQLVHSESLHQKRKNTNPVKPSDVKPNEVLTTELSDNSITEATLQRVKQRREGRLCVRASPRLLALQTEIEAAYDENQAKNNDMSLSHPPAPLDLNMLTNSQPGQEPKEEVMSGGNDSSTRTQLQRGKMRKEKPMPLRSSSRLAALTAPTDDSSVENNNSMISNTLLEPSISSLSYLNGKPSSQPELQDEIIEEASGSSIGNPLRRGQTRRERSTPHRASTHPTALKAASGATYVENENSMTSNALSPTTHSYLNKQPACQPDLDLKEKIEGTNDSSTRTPLRKRKMRRERPVPLRASSRLAAVKTTTDYTSDGNEDNNRRNAIAEASCSSYPDLNLGPTSQPNMEPKDEVIAGAHGRGTRTVLQRSKPCREKRDTIKTSSGLSAHRTAMEAASDESHEKNNKTCNVVSGLQLSSACPDLNLGPNNLSQREPKQETITAVDGSATGTTSRRVQPCREIPTSLGASPCLEALKVTTEAASNKKDRNISMTWNAFSRSSHSPGCPDLNVGPTSQLNIQPQEKIACTNGSATVTTMLHSERSTPIKAMTEAASYGNHNEKINYFCEPVEVSQILMESTSRPNHEEVWFGATTAAPSTMRAEINAPDLNVVPTTWPEHELEHALEPNPGHKLEQQQPTGGDIVSELPFPTPVSSEMPYQDPTMDALLSGPEAGPSMPHMPIDTFNSPLSSFFGDFWHDPCLSYAFRTLTGGIDEQQQLDLGLGPEKYRNGAGARNAAPSESTHIGPSETTSRTLQFTNNGLPHTK